MNITRNAIQLNWCTNTQGSWTAIIDDINPSTQNISFSNGYTATVTNKKVSLTNSTRPTGFVTYEAEDIDNTAYASELAAVGSVKDTLDVVTGERSTKLGVMTLNGTENWSWSSSSPLAYISYTTLGVQAWPNRSGGINAICGILPCVSRNDLNSDISAFSMGDTTGNNQSNIDIRIEGKSSLADVKAWLTENPLTIYYELSTPTSTEDAPQELSLAEGSNTSSMTDTSTGDKPSFPMSYDGTDYTISTKSTRVYLKDVDGTVERVTGVTSFNVRGGRDNIIDLTRMFGSGLEPGTSDAFYSLFPAWRGYRLPYNEGSLLTFKGTGLKSVGFNQFNEEYSEEGKYLTSTGTLTASTSYNVTDYLRAVPGQTYRLTAYGNAPSLCWYTYDKTLISGTAYGHANTWQEDAFTAPANAYWVRFSVYVPRENETCFYFQWSGTRNGDYEQYWDYTRPIPTLTYFPDGMNGRGNIYDEINSRQAIKRFGVVDLGTLEWAHSVVSTYGYWTSTGIQSNVKKPTSSSTVACVISSEYSNVIGASSMGGDAASIGNIAISTSGSILINTGSSTVSPTGTLVYELATPVVTNFDDEVNMSASISDFGTEECLPANGYIPTTAPFRGIVLYQDDYARTITKLPENYQSQDSMNNLLTLLGPLLNGTITATFDSANQVYTYQFTPNA